MKTVAKLAWASLLEHPVRIVLTSIATVASTCMVVWVVSGYDALVRTFDEYANKALGHYVLSVAPIDTASGQAVSAEVMAALQDDPVVAAVEPMWLRRAMVSAKSSVGGKTPQDAASTGTAPFQNPRRDRPDARPSGGGSGMGLGAMVGTGPGGPGRSSRLGPPETMLLGTNTAVAPFAVLRGRWLDPQTPEAPEAVLSAAAAQRLGVEVGGEVLAGKEGQSCELRVVGIMEVPAVVGTGSMAASQVLVPAAGELFLATAVAERIHGIPACASFAGISLQPGIDFTKFRFSWAPRLSRFAVPVQFQEAHDIEEALDQSASADNVRLQAYAATGIAMLVALLVIFSTLNMGVSERIRQFAILRAVVLTRAQVGLLIASEGLLLATIGFLGGIGVGQALLWGTARISAGLLHHGAAPGTNSILLAAISTYGGALLASLVPAYRATRVRPIDAMSRPNVSLARGIPPLMILAGILLVAVNPLLSFVFPPGFDGNVMAMMALGFASLAVGCVLLAPLVVVFVDRLVGPLLARLLGIEPRLLASQLASNLWRTIGAAVSMCIGLGLYITIQVWGFTMLDAFVPGHWAPDALIAFKPAGISPGEAAAVAQFSGVDLRRCQPIVVEQPRLLEDITGSAERASVTRQDNVVIVGIAPQGALAGDRPLLDFEWVEGSPEQAIAIMERGRGAVVPDHFLRETGLKVGDTFALVPPKNPERPVSYTIAGAVRLPGWHWQTKHTGFRPRTHRAAALVFADYLSVAEDFSLPVASHVWLSYGPDGADPDQLAAAAQKLYGSFLQREVAIGGRDPDQPAVQVMPVADIRRATMAAAKRWIWIISQLPLVALVVACFGVLNVILASVRARRWDMGVLRAIGFTRWTLARAVLAECLLIGIVACLLSLGFGVVAGWCGCGLARYFSFFGGMDPALVVPWSRLIVGFGMTIALCLAAAAWPAVQAGRTDILKLLQEGQSAM